MPSIPWTSPRCIYCAQPFGSDEATRRTDEHIILDALGGILTSDCACKKCNSDLGSSVDAKVKCDPAIRLAAHRVRDTIPALAADIEEGQLFTIKTDVASVKARLRKGEYISKWTILPDGSKLAPEDQAIRALPGMLKRDGLGRLAIRRALRFYEKAPYGKRLDLSERTTVVKHAAELAGRDFSDGDAPAIAIAKMAYAFAAMLVGDAICKDLPPLRELRRALKEGDNESPAFKLERLTAKEAAAFHGVSFEGNKPYSIFRIQLFGKAAYRVHFPNIALQVEPQVYTHDLQTNAHWR